MSGNRNIGKASHTACSRKHLARQSWKLGQVASFKHEIGPNRIVQYVYRSNKMKLAAGISGYKFTSFQMFGESTSKNDFRCQTSMNETIVYWIAAGCQQVH